MAHLNEGSRSKRKMNGAVVASTGRKRGDAIPRAKRSKKNPVEALQAVGAAIAKANATARVLEASATTVATIAPPAEPPHAEPVEPPATVVAQAPVKPATSALPSFYEPFAVAVTPVERTAAEEAWLALVHGCNALELVTKAVWRWASGELAAWRDR